ncbi:ubiquitin carboxyl-terminal hydrolase [Mycena metata]|uniref:Ubiquitin carboxyl-terminal hydrolase n=1 Tax=Mycena metata TaxID=1033252 RepID=A0AAD7P0L1_9AGAR|nr:ubiquitin carboxyl-terminal hydrolase [Mycena metata]
MEHDDSNGWQLTESDPSVFTELLKTLGVPLIVDDLYSLDPESLAALQPLHALIFLFKWIPSAGGTSSTTLGGEYDRTFPGFFAHQVVNNACATLAVMNALGNIPSLTAGPQLTELNSFTTGMDPQTRGMVITSADWLREAHNSLSPPSAISLDGLGLPKTSEDAYHFVVYLPAMGCLYELDGLKEFPVKHGPYEETGEGWVKKARETIEARIATYPTGALSTLQASNQHSEAAEIVVKISNENSKRERWAFENSLRRHNHVGLVHALAVALAKAGKLESVKESAKKVMKERIETRKAKGAGADMSDD